MNNNRDAVRSIRYDHVFYRNWYRLLLRIAMAEVVIVAALIFIAWFFYENKPDPKYYATRAGGGVYRLCARNAETGESLEVGACVTGRSGVSQ
jgi:hypothetical protein